MLVAFFVQQQQAGEEQQQQQQQQAEECKEQQQPRNHDQEQQQQQAEEEQQQSRDHDQTIRDRLRARTANHNTSGRSKRSKRAPEKCGIAVCTNDQEQVVFVCHVSSKATSCTQCVFHAEGTQRRANARERNPMSLPCGSSDEKITLERPHLSILRVLQTARSSDISSPPDGHGRRVNDPQRLWTDVRWVCEPMSFPCGLDNEKIVLERPHLSTLRILQMARSSDISSPPDGCGRCMNDPQRLWTDVRRQAHDNTEANQRDTKSPLSQKLKRLKGDLIRIVKLETGKAELHLLDLLDLINQAKGKCGRGTTVDVDKFTEPVLQAQSRLELVLLNVQNIERVMRKFESLFMNIIKEADQAVGSESSRGARSIVPFKVKRKTITKRRKQEVVKEADQAVGSESSRDARSIVPFKVKRKRRRSA
eukprot:jgi/Bigna1/90911/estExt_fgenesh1_pg.C_820078